MAAKKDKKRNYLVDEFYDAETETNNKMAMAAKRQLEEKERKKKAAKKAAKK